jgi:hypothetical protein
LRRDGPAFVKQATDPLNRTELGIADYLTKVESVEFPTTAEKTAFGLFAAACGRQRLFARQVG